MGAKHAELVVLGVSHDHPADPVRALADVGSPRPEGLQAVYLGLQDQLDGSATLSVEVANGSVPSDRSGTLTGIRTPAVVREVEQIRVEDRGAGLLAFLEWAGACRQVIWPQLSS